MLLPCLPAVRRPCSRIGLLAILGLSASCFEPAPGASNADTDDATTNATTGVSTSDTTNDTSGGMTSITTSVTASDPTMTTAESESTAVETSNATTGDEPECGDEVVEGDEECDDGSANGDTAACTSSCTNAVCGDGLVWDGMEECDDANADDSDDCLAACTTAVCGDGAVQTGVEECDDAGESAECDTDCTLASCGDTVTNVLAGEECDDGNSDNDDACLGSCVDASCGDGFVYAGTETCDGADLDGWSCANFGLLGDIACDAQCDLDTTECYSLCPDGGARVNDFCWYLSAGCDNTDVTCASHGLTGTTGYINSVWDLATLTAIADHYGWIAGGDINCCVEFGWVQDGALYTHNYGAQFYNWDGCYDVYATLKACNPP